MRKILIFCLVISVLFSLVSGVTVNAESRYGTDNLNNAPGDLVIGFIGGSITEGAGCTSAQNRYTTYLINNYFKTKFPNKNVIEKNIAIGGSASSYGHIRLKRDFELGGEKSPDVVFVEFAVNDSSLLYEGYGKDQIVSYMESIVRQLLTLPKIPAIVFVYTASTDKDKVEEVIGYHHEVAERYGIYEINLHEYVWNGVDEGKWVWRDDESELKFLANDGVHPNDNGYRVYAERIAELLDKDYDKAFSEINTDTAPVGKIVYQDIEEIHLSDSSVALGRGWDYVKNIPPTDPYAMNNGYPNRFFKEGYYEINNCNGRTIEVEFEGRGFGLDMIRTQNNGSFNWEVYDENGNLEDSGVYTCYYLRDGARCMGEMVTTGLKDGKHKLVLTGVINQKSIDDNKENPGNGGNGKYMALAYIAIEKSPDKSISFKDTTGHWAEKDILFMAERGIVSGVGEGSFRPDRNITRAEFATLIVKALGLAPVKTDAFADVTANAWYNSYVGAAANAGIIAGFEGSFRPEDTITRQEMAVVIMKAYAYLGKNAKSGNLDKFADKAQVAAWAADSVSSAVATGLMSGMSEDIFAPADNATRAQATSLIKRLIS